MNTRLYNITLSYYLLDLVLLTVSFFVTQSYRYAGAPPQHSLWGLVILLSIWIGILLAKVSNPELLSVRLKLRKRLALQVTNFMILTGLASAALFAFKLGNYSRLQIYGAIALFFVLKSVFFVVSYAWLKSRRLKGRHLAKVLVIGAGQLGQKYYKYTEAYPEVGYKVIGFLDNDTSDKPKDIQEKVLGKLNEMSKVLDHLDVDVVVVALPSVEADSLKLVVNTADFYGKRIRLIPDFYRIANRRYNITKFGDMSLVNVDEIPLDKLINFTIKRLFDIVVSFLALLMLLAPMALIALLIKLDSRGSVFYRPVRISQGGKPFKMLKFRTMYKNSDTIKIQGSSSTVKDDPRITKIGRVLRKTNLDELPQLWNVLVGNMSLVGPRPHRVALNADLQKSVVRYMVRHYVKPGITGWAQVNGWRGPTVTKEQREERTHHDLWYIENWSFWLDLKILWLTVFGKDTYKNAF